LSDDLIEGAVVSETVESLVCDLLAWLAPGERPYAEVLDAWRTSCPRLPVWEEANDRGFIAHSAASGRAMVGLTAAGRSFLRRRG
jgi:D-3-phosphoglycerate dehydrogenase